ncbi:MAG: hypothetical protein LBO80_00400 [Treponema sp.]|jgi:hypothetical protein|nr:hypothetical protein [Treponema sp.]
MSTALKNGAGQNRLIRADYPARETDTAGDMPELSIPPGPAAAFNGIRSVL